MLFFLLVAGIRPLFGGSRARATTKERPVIPKNGIVVTRALQREFRN
jgi:hypothetical protein